MVNDNHSRLGQKYIERWIMPSFLKAVNDYPIVALTGARQVGKSTFLKNTPRLKDWPYITLDDYDVLEAAKNDPGSLLAGKSRLIIDEIQKAPKLFNELKMAVDKNRKNRFIISGSANLLLSEKISESLAGRAVYHLLIPFAFREANNKGQGKILDLLFKDKRPLTLKHDLSLKPSSSLENIILKGFYPPVITGPKALSFALGWLEGFVSTFLERDLRNFAQISNLPDFRRLMTVLALRSGQMLNQSDVNRDANIPQPTVHRYINILEAAYLLEKVPIYAVNRTKRLIKTPKIYFNDPGLASFLMGYHSKEDLGTAKEKGAAFETLVFHLLKVWASLKTPSANIFYWRTVSGHEVDFVIELGRKLVAVEVKSSSNVKYSDAANIKLFMKEYPQTKGAVIVYTGREIKRIGENIYCVPWDML